MSHSSNGGSAPYTWVTSNPSVVKLRVDEANSNYCDFYGVSPGTATVTLYSYKLVVGWGGSHIENMTEQWTVTVVPNGPAAKYIKLNKSSLKLNKGKTKALSYYLSPSDAEKSVTWKSSNTYVATVNSSGVVTARNGGKTIITVTTSNGKTAKCRVTVTVKAKKVKLSKSKLIMSKGESKKISCTLSPRDTTEKATFSSSNRNVATVNSKGKITAVNLGKATITAKTPSGKKAQCRVTVKKQATGIKLKNRAVKLNKGLSQTLKYTLSPKGSISKIKWSSNNKKVATVNSNGKIKARGRGTATISAKLPSGKSAKCKVTVYIKATGINFSKSALTINRGESKNLSYTISPRNTTEKATFSSSNKKVVTVNSKGKITARNVGTATISAKIPSGKTAKCRVTVYIKATGISFSQSALTINRGESKNLSYTISPRNTTEKATFSSSNNNVVTVNSKGRITARNVGTATISAKIPSGKTAKCRVTVTQKNSDSDEKEEHIIIDNQVSLGNSYSAVLRKNGDLYTFGSNAVGQLGDGTTDDSHIPVKIMSNVKSISIGNYHSAAIKENGDLYTWGDNYYGQLGNGTKDDSPSPQKIMSNVKTVCLGKYGHSAAIKENGDLYIWGDDSFDLLGNGTKDDSPSPQKIMSNVKSVSLGISHCAAIKENGDLYTWGLNTYGELGDGTNNSSDTPIKVMTNVKAVSLGNLHSAAIKENGDLYTWGDNYYGQLGNGTTDKSSSPQKIMSNIKAVSLGWNNSAAVKENGDLYTWGNNNYGELGDGTDKDSNVPIKVMGNIMAVSLGNNHSAAIKENGDLYTWGDNYYGQLGNGTTDTSLVPIKIDIY